MCSETRSLERKRRLVPDEADGVDDKIATRRPNLSTGASPRWVRMRLPLAKQGASAYANLNTLLAD
jgi:hypothetical protein